MPRPGALKVWYIPQVPMKPFEVVVPNIETAKIVLNTIIDFSLFEYKNRVKPDFSDAGGIVRWEWDGDNEFDWFDYDVEEDEDA